MLQVRFLALFASLTLPLSAVAQLAPQQAPGERFPVSAQAPQPRYLTQSPQSIPPPVPVGGVSQHELLQRQTDAILSLSEKIDSLEKRIEALEQSKGLR